jgi:multidrug resistance protein MdtO
MTSLVQMEMEPKPPLGWLRQMLEEELAPYPGRVALVARMLIASTLVMILVMTFRLPFGAFAVIFTLIISREDQQSTLKAVRTIIVGFVVGAAAVILGALVSAGDPMLRFFWTAGILFTIFFALSAMTNFPAAARFGYLVAITLSLWDQHISSAAKVTGTLWAVGTISLASVLTVAIEFVFAALRPWDDLLRSIAERLAVVEEALRCYAAHGRLDDEVINGITRMAVLGTSRLRRVLLRGTHLPHYGEQMGAAVALAGGLVDLAANLASMRIAASTADRRRMGILADNLAGIRDDLIHRRIPKLAVAAAGPEMTASLPLLREMEQLVGMIPEVFAGSQSLGPFAAPPPGQAPPATFLAPDAFRNPDHMDFAIRGCLAATLCYVIYMALAWPGIATSVAICFITAITTIGASRQIQTLRFAGSLAGGAVGMAAQVWVLPHLDTIGGFTLLFMVVTLVSAWIITSGPRISYFGVQLAVGFYLIHLQEFKFQTSLAVARDRIVGLVLGLAMMWLVADRLLGAPAVVEMRRALVSVLRSLAQLARGQPSDNLQDAIDRSYSLRDTINRGFDKVRAFADGVLFALGPSRDRDLALRTQILGLTPRLRLLFLTHVALLKYRLQVPGFDLPAPIRAAQREFDEHLAAALSKMGDQLEAKPFAEVESLDVSLARLERSVESWSSAQGPGLQADHLQTFLSLSRRIAGLAVSLDMGVRPPPGAAGND